MIARAKSNEGKQKTAKQEQREKWLKTRPVETNCFPQIHWREVALKSQEYESNTWDNFKESDFHILNYHVYHVLKLICVSENEYQGQGIIVVPHFLCTFTLLLHYKRKISLSLIILGFSSGVNTLDSTMEQFTMLQSMLKQLIPLMTMYSGDFHLFAFFP